MLESPKVSKAFYVIEHWLDLSSSTVRSLDGHFVPSQVVRSYGKTVAQNCQFVPNYV